MRERESERETEREIEEREKEKIDSQRREGETEERWRACLGDLRKQRLR
jgi:hypothetical protein